MTSKLIAFVTALLVPSLVIGCGSGSGGDSEPIKVGAVLSITGPAGSLGTPEKETVEAFQEEFGRAGDSQIEWIIEDDRSDTNGAVSAVNRLVTEEQVDAIICCSTSPNSLAIQTAIEQAGVPNLSLAAASAIVEPANEKEWFFKTPYNDRLTLQVAVDDMLARGIERVAFLGFEDAYGESGLNEFEAIAEEAGVEITGTETFAPDDTDVSAQITRLRATDPDAYVIWGIPPGAAVAQRDVRNLGIEEPVYQSFGVANESFLEVSGKAAEDVRLAGGRLLVPDDIGSATPLEREIKRFVDEYTQRVGEPPNPFSGNARDAMAIIHDAANRAIDKGASVEDADAFHQALRDEIEATQDLVGVTGIYTFGPDDHAGLDERSVIMIGVEGGDFVAAKGPGA